MVILNRIDLIERECAEMPWNFDLFIGNAIVGGYHLNAPHEMYPGQWSGWFYTSDLQPFSIEKGFESRQRFMETVFWMLEENRSFAEWLERRNEFRS